MEEISPSKTRVLIVDDEPAIRNLLVSILGHKYQCAVAASAEEAIALIEAGPFDLVISDINMTGMSGIDLIEFVKASSPDTVMMMISGNRTIDSPIEAIRKGAFDYLKKPFDIDEVEIAAARGIEHAELRASKRRHEGELEKLVEERTSRLNYLAYHDALTGLSNRVFIEDDLAKTLWKAGGTRTHAIILVSLDNYAAVRDSLGHSVGDGLLQEVAGRLTKLSGTDARTARFEGDQFALLVSDQTHTQLAAFGERITRLFDNPFRVRENEIFVSASIGISLSPRDGSDAVTLIKNASSALSYARKLGGNNYQFYSSQIHNVVIRRIELENNLRHALDREEFDVYYQPKVDFVSGRIVGMEALLRWDRSDLGRVSPAQFIPVAEETGSIVAISEWVLKTACAAAKSWRDQGFDLHVASNLSPRQFQQPNIAECLVDAVRSTGLNPSFVNLEVTEGSILSNPEAAIAALRELRKSGITISIDDFGVGYSSLAYLKDLPIDVLKIDKSFITNVTEDPDDAALVMAIMTLAHNLGLKVVAEGVEHEEQLRFLRLLKCDEWQGYLCSKAVSKTGFDSLLELYTGIPAFGSKTPLVSRDARLS